MTRLRSTAFYHNWWVYKSAVRLSVCSWLRAAVGVDSWARFVITQVVNTLSDKMGAAVSLVCLSAAVSRTVAFVVQVVPSKSGVLALNEGSYHAASAASAVSTASAIGAVAGRDYGRERRRCEAKRTRAMLYCRFCDGWSLKDFTTTENGLQLVDVSCVVVDVVQRDWG